MAERDQRTRTLSGRLVGLSAGDAQDVQAYGLLPRHLDLVFGTVVGALALRGARLAYGGDLRQRGFTEQLYEGVAEAYADDYLTGESPTPPFVHYLAASIWTQALPEPLGKWLTTSVGLVEVRFMTGDGYIAVTTTATGEYLVKGGGLKPFEAKVKTVDDLLKGLQQRAPSETRPAPSLAQMRQRMGRECDVRILLGGKMFDYSGDEPGIGAEARESLAQGAVVLPLGAFGGAAADVARQLGLWSRKDMAAREATQRGPGYDRVMKEVGEHRGRLFDRLGGKIEDARKLASTSDIKEAARLVVGILESLPKRAEPGPSGLRGAG